MDNNSEKLQKFISAAGLMSRRRAEEAIEKGLFKINGKVAKLGDRVTDLDRVTYQNKPLRKANKMIYLLFNKPKYVVSTLNDPQNRKTIKDFLLLKQYVYPVGRLDYDTTGALLITNDGDLTNKLLHPSHEIERVYVATLDRALTNEELKFLNSDNVFIDGQRSLQVVESIQDKEYRIKLKEGRYHHVKNLFLEANAKVIQLHRSHFAFLGVKGIKEGKMRDLTYSEVKRLKEMIK
ncbi:pseudouridine synthase [Mycoplasma phocoenae]|uniref:Pseudouridine synthase n=1 Tax=Mycoplasma phocoenae TaxID=754517 RepID=A0A858U743_9MOLU|nr:pseudouridine synthase [Mycoplasma phocoenae]QJG67085.1 rRNA pseudouridine synthase [Mycoplasma phocoenae]